MLRHIAYSNTTTDNHYFKILWLKDIENIEDQELVLIIWTIINIGGDLIVLNERSSGLSPDLIVDNIETELKNTSGNLNTLDTQVRKAAKQTEGRRLVINIDGKVSYSNEEAIDVISRRMFRNNLREVYVLKDYFLVNHMVLCE